ncbi:hypothetical protein D7Y57_03630 [Stenotrophomonas maltophilia]|nr:hypothetical protein DF40_009135 [Stenotrophomonas maltophilia M30]MBA0233248.1 hypothetical protein [Stenotrophomonas maltophilia]MBA0267287.1 hypothetical protein [Stenotrophomonas maltophilia]MBA0455231.1 hypothetical protein [Stenotrophomonas maltophilia]
MISFALESGADINARLGWITPLETAIYANSFRLIPFLIEHGARPVEAVEGWEVHTLTDANIVSVFLRQNGGPLKVEGAEYQNIVDGLSSFEAKTQKNTLLRELAIALDDVENSPRRRM